MLNKITVRIKYQKSDATMHNILVKHNHFYKCSHG